MRTNLVFGEELPLLGKVSITACLGGRTPRPRCHCCGGSIGVRRGWRHLYRHDKDYPNWEKYQWKTAPSKGHKPRHKDHRRNHIWKDDIMNTGG